MVRTKGDGAATKVVGSKAPRKQLVSNTGASSSSPASSGKAKQPSVGLPYCPQPTPEWQKSVKEFFKFAPKPSDDKENVKETSDEEKDNSSEKVTPKSKGKQPKKGKKTSKKTSKKEEAMEEDTEAGDKESQESNDKDDEKDNDDKNNSDNDQEPVPKKRNRIIESDDDD